MVLRRARLSAFAPQAAAAPPAGGPLAIADVRAFPLREPVSKRSYTVLRVSTRGGLTGYGECAAASPAELDAAREALRGSAATAYEAIQGRIPAALAGGLNMALLDITGRHAKAPAYQVLGGPTRNKARALARIEGSADEELASAAQRAYAAGFRAFAVPAPPSTARNQGQAFARAVRRRMDALRAALPDSDFVLDAAGALTPGDASSVAAALERFHLLWLEEPCRAANLAALRKIAGESVTPLGFGRSVEDAAGFQDLLREQVIDILRPDIARHGIAAIRKIAALAETYYVAVAPRHEGGPVATAAALHLAASLPNFFIQQIPYPAAAEDRAMRAAITRGGLEGVRDGYAALPTGPGLGIQVDEKALERYAL